jgi:hypothetical protein
VGIVGVCELPGTGLARGSNPYVLFVRWYFMVA